MPAHQYNALRAELLTKIVSRMATGGAVRNPHTRLILHARHNVIHERFARNADHELVPLLQRAEDGCC